VVVCIETAGRNRKITAAVGVTMSVRYKGVRDE